MLMKTKIILGISIFIILGLIIGLSVYFTLPKSSKSSNIPKIDYLIGKTLIGNSQCQEDLDSYLFETDSTGNKPDITSNTINVDISKILNPLGRYGYGCKLKIYVNTINNYYMFNITSVDVSRKTVTFNAPANFTLSSAQAWPIDITICKDLPAPTLIF